jgi:hypothetical protein
MKYYAVRKAQYISTWVIKASVAHIAVIKAYNNYEKTLNTRIMWKKFQWGYFLIAKGFKKAVYRAIGAKTIEQRDHLRIVDNIVVTVNLFFEVRLTTACKEFVIPFLRSKR